MRLASIFLLSIFVLFSPAAHGAEREMQWAEKPNWAHLNDPATLELEDKDEVRGGYYYLLASRQYRHAGENEREQFYQYSVKISARSGLEDGSTISINFRPEIDDLEFHSVTVIRDDERIDFTGDLEFNFFQREEELERGIIDGQMTAFANIPRVQVGDIIEYSFSKNYSSVLLPREFFWDGQQTFSAPVALLETSVILPQDMPLKHNAIGFESSPTIAKDDEFVRYAWVFEQTESRSQPDNTPDWFSVHNKLEASTIDSWATVVEDALPHYSDDADLPRELQIRLDKIKTRYPSKKRQLSEALELVQNRIRYVGIEISYGAFVPRLPNTVWNNGYGDCKDKALLLVAALNYLDIDADVVLVNTLTGKVINPDIPSPYVFNHAIIKATIDGKTYWLDPTLSPQQSPDPIDSVVDYGFGLVLKPGVDALERMTAPEILVPNRIVTETLSPGYKLAQPVLEMTVESTLTGGEADRMLRRIENSGLKELGKQYLKYYNEMYEGIELANPITYDHDSEQNVLTITENYVLNDRGKAEKVLKNFAMKGDNVRRLLIDEVNAEGEYPIRQEYPAFSKHVVVFEGLKESFNPLDTKWIIKPFADFNGRSWFHEDKLTTVWLLRTKTDHIAVDQLAEYREFADQAFEHTNWTYDVRYEIEDANENLRRSFEQ